MLLRKSEKRDRILSLLKSVTCHPTAEWIYFNIKEDFPEISLATIYRNLEQLKEMGLIQKLEIEDKITHFDGDCSNHFHLFCTECKNVFDIPFEIASLPVKKITAATSFDVTDYTISFRGVCPDCKGYKINNM